MKQIFSDEEANCPDTQRKLCLLKYLKRKIGKKQQGPGAMHTLRTTYSGSVGIGQECKGGVGIGQVGVEALTGRVSAVY